MNPLMFKSRTRRSINIVILALIFVSALLGTAKAGDIANRHILGFSPDGAYFAFEEFGVQDGSGFPYSNIFITNTRNNSWVKGSPFRVLLRDDQEDPRTKLDVSLEKARATALAKAKLTLDKYKIDSKSSSLGTLLAHNPITEMGRDPHRVTVAPAANPFWQKYKLTFNLKDEPIETKRCKDYGSEAQMGYELSVERHNKEVKVLHKDTRIPTSRGCPKKYAISDIIRFTPDNGYNKKSDQKESLYIVLLQIFSYGFEGDDGRFLATSFWLPTIKTSN